MLDMMETINRKNCGNILAEIRQKFGSISVAEIAKVLGVSRSTIMRIEDGRTLPSDEFLNRLKALQVIGLSKFRKLSENDKKQFTQLIEEIGEKPEVISEAVKKIAMKRLTPIGILAGLGVIGSASFVTGAVVSSVPVISGIAGYGVIKGIGRILKANNLTCTEVDGRWEIIKSPRNIK